MTGWLWNLVNIGVSLCGYYLAAFLIDHKFYGRKRMQTVGFLADAVLFLIPASKSKSHILSKTGYEQKLIISLVL